VTGTDPAPGRPSDQPAAVPGTGGPRSEGTRRAILGAARAAFAARGYEQTTIRAVAAQAGVDASMVMRYFGSKAGLFTAAATMDLQVPDLGSAPAAQRGELLLRTAVDRWEDTASDDELIVLLRTAVTSEAVAAQLQAAVGQLITGPVAALGGDGAAERAGFIAAQLLGLALCRYILRLEPLASLPADEVVAAVAPSIQRYLTPGAPPGPAPPGMTPAPADAAGHLSASPEDGAQVGQDLTVSREHVLAVLEHAGVPRGEAREAAADLQFPAPLSVVTAHMLRYGITPGDLVDRLGGSP
jgi:AcrR family transcriptional regulator